MATWHISKAPPQRRGPSPAAEAVRRGDAAPLQCSGEPPEGAPPPPPPARPQRAPHTCVQARAPAPLKKSFAEAAWVYSSRSAHQIKRTSSSARSLTAGRCATDAAAAAAPALESVDEPKCIHGNRAAHHKRLTKGRPTHSWTTGSTTFNLRAWLLVWDRTAKMRK